ncbi:glycine--tRNA ligase [Halobacteriales archaeon SW_7_68_16]|nr:MAG: glycine--tRNA ligase [Halobacteriales archaeon SW_7_68_16]
MTDLVELAKRRGFFFGSSEPYGGVAGFYTYGPQGAALKRNVESAWRDRFTVREGHTEIDAPTVMPEAVFEASGHLDGFDDMLVDCAGCGASHRADHLVEDVTELADAEALPTDEVADLIADHGIACPECDESLAGQPVETFNLMFETTIGPGSSSPGYLRPETAQGTFVDFPRLAEYARNQLPFGVTQIGSAYRNEISPRGGLLRLRELTQAELEHFVHPERDDPDIAPVAEESLPLYAAADQEGEGSTETMTVAEAVDRGVVDSEWIAYYLGRARRWFVRIGVDPERLRFRQHTTGELAHYASDCWDAEADVGDGESDWIELAGFAYRGDYDLSKHAAHASEEYTVFEQYDRSETVERATVDPDMSYLGPEFGGAAEGIADALERLAERDRAAFDGDEVVVEVDGEGYTVPVERTGFGIEAVTKSGEHVRPHVVEPAFGVDRAVCAVLAHNLRTDEVDDEDRTYLSLPPEVAPTLAGVFPLMTRDGLDFRAENLAEDLQAAGLAVTYDDSGAIGRRYRRQDEIGTPYCVTVDYDTLEDDTVTIRDRDSTDQRRVPIDDLAETLAALRDGGLAFDDL